MPNPNRACAGAIHSEEMRLRILIGRFHFLNAFTGARSQRCTDYKSLEVGLNSLAGFFCRYIILHHRVISC